MEAISSLEGRIIFSTGKTRTTTIIRIIRFRVVRCLGSKGSGLRKVIPLPIFRFSLKPKRKMVIRMRENTMAKPKMVISVEKESRGVREGSASYAVSMRPRNTTPRAAVGKLPPARAPQLMATAPVSLSILDSSQMAMVIGARKARTVK